MRTIHERHRLGYSALALTCVLVACSVDTSGIHFVPDDVLEKDGLGGLPGTGGLLNGAGKKAVEQGGDGATDPAGGTENAGMDAGGKGSGGSNSGGAPPVGGRNTGGTSAVAGAPGGGVTGMGGMPAAGYPCQSVVAASRTIATFEGLMKPTDTWMFGSLSFGFYTYPPNNGSTPVIKVGDGKLTVEVVKVMQPVGFGIWMSDCADAATPKFSSLSFTVSGMKSNGQQLKLRVGLNTNTNQIADPMLRKGGCVQQAGVMDGSCRPAAVEVALTGMEQKVSLSFDMFRDGSPAMRLNPAEITGVEWGLIYLNGDAAYDATVVVDDVTFQ